MILNKLSVLNYKNIRQAEIACSSKMNYFFNKNLWGVPMADRGLHKERMECFLC